MIERSIFILLLSFIPMFLYAQKENKDSLEFKIARPDSFQISPNKNLPDLFDWEYKVSATVDYDFSRNPVFLYRVTRSPQTDNPGMFSWKSGAVIVSGNSAQLPGMMAVDNGSIDVYQAAGNFTFNAGATATKYGYFRGLHTQYGVHGSATYRFSPALSAVVFGSYYFGRPPVLGNGLPMTPAMLGYYNRNSFGGYADVAINEMFGVHVGAQMVQRTGTMRYEAEPIVSPYIRAGRKKNIKIELPVGQIMYNVLKHNIIKHR